jgi:two-component system, OmpR family, response regulator MtrA
MGTTLKVLLASDSSTSGFLWAFRLQEKSFDIVTEPNLPHLIQRCRTENPNLVILDLPTLDAKVLKILQELREELTVPLLLLTSGQEIKLILQAYEAGADDCILKPIEPTILHAKINAWLRRSLLLPVAMLTPLRVGKVHLVPGDRMVIEEGGSPIHLTNRETRLLYVLMSRAGHTIPFEELIQMVWGYNRDVGAAVLKNMIYRLRQELEREPANLHCIQTVPGCGYKFDLCVEPGAEND